MPATQFTIAREFASNPPMAQLQVVSPGLAHY